MSKHSWLSAVVVPLFLLQAPLCAVTINQVQTFDDPNHNWIIGAGPGPGTPASVPLALGGPGGASDPYLSIVSTGGDGPRSRLTAQNFGQWAGDYTAERITHILMDVRNFGSTDLSLRLLFVAFGAMGPANVAFTTNAVFVPGSSDWQTVQFDVSPSALTATLGSATNALSNAGELRIFHNPSPSFAQRNLPAVIANLGVDNITAAAIPEPATWTLLIGGVLAMAVVRRSRG